jgi:F-type H+-transporting ATPase subunit a
MKFSPDQYILVDWGWGRLNATIVVTWLEMGLLVFLSRLVSRRLSSGPEMSRWQNLVEVLVGGIARHIEAVTNREARPFLPFVGTLFLFILLSNVLAVVPFYLPPTGALSTTTALALCVFVAVPVFGLTSQGGRGYFRQYLQPSVFMLPFNILGEISRTFALAVRLYGNLMSSTVIANVLLIIMPFFFPVVMQALGLLTGVIQAYIFPLLALMYIASAMQQEGKAPASGMPTSSEERLWIQWD